MKRAAAIGYIVVGMLFGIALGVRINASTAQMKTELSMKSFEPRGTFSLIVAGGQCQYGNSEEGMWHQQGEGRETSRNYRPRCGKLGLGYRPANSHYGINATYFDAGRATLSSTAIAYPDDDAKKHNPNTDTLRLECLNEPAPDCAQRIRGSGGIRGFNVTVTYDFLKIWKLVAEAGVGVSAYRSSWEVRVLPLDPNCLGDDNKCRWQAQINQRTGWLLSPTASLKVKYAPFFVAVDYQARTIQHAQGSMGYGKGLTSFFIGGEFPFWSL